MAGCGRFLAVRAGVAAIAAGLAVAASAASSEAAANSVDIAIQVGYHGTIKLGQWMPVAVDLTNHGQQLDGTLEIDAASSLVGKGAPPAGSAVYQTPLTLAPGATKHFRTYLTEAIQGNVEVRVVQGGRVVDSAQVGTPAVVSGLLVAVLSDDPAALDGIATIHPGGVAPTVVHLAGADLPDSALVLRAFDLIAIDNFSTDTLTTGQRNALVDYVMQGGSLLLSTGGSWHKTLAGLPAAIVPLQVSGSTVLPTTPALGGMPGVEIATGAISPGATAWLADGGRPLLIEAPVGSGLVAMATFDWAQGTITASSTATELLRQLVVRSTFGSPGGGATATAAVGGNPGFINSVAARGGSLTQALGNVPSLDLPAWWLIGGLVLVYILLVGPVNYFVLRAIGRRALAWVTVPTIAIVASGGAYGASVLTKGTSVLANEISIVHVVPGWDRVYNEAYTGIVAPTRGDYEVALGSGARMISPINNYYMNPGDPSLGALRINTATGGVTLPAMTAFTLRGFAAEDIDAGPAIVASAEIVGGQLTGTIKNMSSVDVTDGVVMSGGGYQTFGRLAPGASVAFKVQPQTSSGFNGNPTYMQIYPSSMCCGGPPNSNSDTERQNQTRTVVLGALSGSDYGGPGIPATSTVVLWTKQPFQQITVNGAHPRTYVESALVLNLQVGQVGVGNLPAGIVNGRIIDIDANLMPGGPPGLTIASSGSITYSFEPMLSPGARLGSVSILSSNPYGPKFAAAPGSVAAKGQVWDWARSSWVAVSYMDGGTTSIPIGAVNPTTGEVRLKIASDGQFSAGYVSLSGTVS